jgi:hypothetical protein
VPRQRRMGWVIPGVMGLSLLVIAGFLYAGYSDKHRTWLTLGIPLPSSPSVE